MLLKSQSDQPLLHIETFKDSLLHHEPAELSGFFEIYWIRGAPRPELLGEHTKPPEGEWIYLVAPLAGYVFDTKDKEGTLLAFHREFLNLEVKEFFLDVLRLFEGTADFATLFVPEEEVATLQALVQIMRRETEKKPGDFLFLKNLLKSFLLKLVSLKEERYHLPDINGKRVYHFLLLVENHFKTHRETGFYAGKLNLSSKRLNQILKERLGRTISQILQERVAMEAKRQIYQGTRSIMEIGVDLGFADKSYFSRFFRKMTGRSPEGYRKEIESRL